MKTLILASACAAALLSAAPAAAVVTIVPAGTQAPAVSTGPAVSPTPPPTVTAPVQPVSPAQHVGRWHQACDGDVARFCGGITSKPAITACLDRNTDKLSPECKAIRGEEERHWRREHRKR